MPYKVAIDCRFYSDHTGLGNYIRNLLNQYREQSPDQFQFTLLSSDENHKSLTNNYPNWQIINTHSPHYSFAEQTKLSWCLSKLHPDLVHFTNFNRPLAYWGKSIVTIHDLTLHKYPGQKLNKPHHRLAYHTIFKRSINQANAIITVSNHTAKDLFAYYPQTRKKTVAIHLGINPEFLNRQPRSTNQTLAALPKRYLLYTGNWREHKNIINLIHAFHLLKKQYRYPGGLVLTGNPLSHHNNIPALVEDLGIEEVYFPGIIPASNLPTIYQNAEAYVFPSFYEGFGLPMLEAMQAKTPIIASNTTSLPEVGGEAAIYFDPHSPQEMAIQIDKVVNSPELQNQLITKGKERIKAFDYANTAKQTLELYETICSNP